MCFLAFNEMSDEPRNKHMPMTYRSVSGQPAQSSFEKPCVRACLRYLRTLQAALKWTCLRVARNLPSCCTMKVISGRVVVRYSKKPISLLHDELFR